MIIRTINEYHNFMRQKGSNMQFMAFRDENGEELKTGFVLSGYRGKDSHRYGKTREELEKWAKDEISKEII